MKILEMLSYRRPAGSKGEQAFLERFVMPYRPNVMAGNLVITVPGDPKTLFSCHTDTVHRDDARQQVIYDAGLALAYKDDDEPLGADDTAGVWLMLEMLEAGVPGTYVFHFGEEKGCIGSKAMAREHPKWLQQFDRAIAFDRRDNTSVITHQMGYRCCSDEFGLALTARLGGGYVLDDTGLYTDTASYDGLIPECTNLSVGYQHQHCPEETLDVAHLEWLRDQVVMLDWSTLPTKRDPDVVHDEYDEYMTGANSLKWFGDDEIIDIVDGKISNYNEAEDLVYEQPELCARALYALLLERDFAGDDAVTAGAANDSCAVIPLLT